MKVEFLQKVYESSLFVADYLNFSEVKCNDNEQLRSIENIEEDILKLTRKLL